MIGSVTFGGDVTFDVNPLSNNLKVTKSETQKFHYPPNQPNKIKLMYTTYTQ